MRISRLVCDKWMAWFACLCLLIVYTCGQPLHANQGKLDLITPSNDSSFKAQLDKLKARINKDGSLRVIVKLKHDDLKQRFQSESNLTPQARHAQRINIRDKQNRLINKLARQNIFKVKRFKYIPYLALEADSVSFQQLESLPEVESIQEDWVYQPTLSDTVTITGADMAAVSGYSGQGKSVAILDTGIDSTHSSFAGKVVAEACFSTTSTAAGAITLCPNGLDEQVGPGAAINCSGNSVCDHGTHVAGIAVGNNASTFGIARDANLIPIQVFSRIDSVTSSCGSPPCLYSYSSDIILALEWLYSQRDNYDIAAINLSLGGDLYSSAAACDAANPFTKAAIDNLRAVGIATVIAAGNEGRTNAIAAPGCISTAVSVGATTKTDIVASFSNNASWLSLLAPGVSIRSSLPGGGFGRKSGSSMAAPHVTGAWAVMKSKYPNISVDAALSSFSNTGKPILDIRNDLTKSRLQIDAALGVAPLQIDTTSLQNANVNNSYSAALSASGGASPYSWTVVIGTLPDGLTLDSVSGVISGIPASVESKTFSVQVQDNLGNAAIQELSLSVNGAISTLLTEDFNDGDFAGWTVTDEGSNSAPSNWSAASGMLVQSTNIHSLPTSAADITKLGSYLHYEGGSSWRDYRLTLTVRSDDDDAVGVMFRVQDSDNYYRFSWDKQRNYRRLVKRENGVFSLLASDAVSYVSGTSYQLEVQVQGGLLEVSIDGNLIFSVVDSSFSNGSVALYSWANAGAFFDDIQIENVSGANVAPIITALSAAPMEILDTDTSQLLVTASDADNGPNPLSYTWTVLAGQGSLNDPSLANPVYTPPDVTGTQVFTLSVAVSDGRSTISQTIDVTVQDADAPPTLLTEDFNDGDFAGWTVTDEGSNSAPSNWSAASGMLVQSTNIHSLPTSAADITKLGSYLHYEGGSSWRDYRLTLTVRSDDDDAVGVMFRVQDSDNYYRFSWDKQRNYRRLVKRENGVFSLLASDAVSYVSGTSYQLEVQVQGGLLEVSIDGNLIFSVVDSSFSNGSVALYSWANAGAFFDDIVVQ